MPNIPPPRVRLIPRVLVEGRTRSGNNTFAYGQVIVSLEDVPQVFLTDSSYRFQLELLRYVPKRRRLGQVAPDTNRYGPQPQGFYHPSSWVDGTAPTAVAGTRGGSQNGVAVNRQTEWPLTGFVEEQKITLDVAEVLLPYFELLKIDDNQGNSVEALAYFIGKKRKSPNGVLSYGQNPFLGVFRFRYAAYDVVAKRFVVGAYSEPVFVRPQKWPTIENPGSTFNRKRLINTNSVTDPTTGRSCFTQLVASVGGRITGRMW